MKQKYRTSNLLKLLCLILFAGFLTFCGSSRNINISKDYLYFSEGDDTVTMDQKEVVIRSNDVLSIQVFSRTLNQEQAAVFNMPLSANNQTQGYLVNLAGNIEMPVIGSVPSAGLTKSQLQAVLVERLTTYVKNPYVIIRFMQFNINVLGEVKSPGTQSYQVERVTIIDAISAAGDLTDFGKREDVTVIREEDGKKNYYTINLRSRHLFESPVYALRPNDIVYVGPNNIKLKALSIDPEKQRKTNMFFAITSLVIGTATLILTFLR